jgi:hypothetical protein
METIFRRSPAVFNRPVKKREIRNNWDVVLEYDNEGSGPYLIDLSHLSRWDIQDKDLDRFKPWEIRLPETPGHCLFHNGVLINRMNQNQASIWHLVGEKLDEPDDPVYTETTDGTVFLGIYGNDVFAITEKLTSLDFLEPSRKAPFLLQGPFAHVPCQIVTVENTAERSGILLTCSRGYAQDMVDAILSAGDEYDLRSAGETVFRSWLNLWAIRNKSVDNE